MKENSPEINHESRIEIIDGFRAIAILLVVFYHFYSLNSNSLPNQTYKSIINYFPYDYLTSGGAFGVEFFFIISGFVIFFSLQKSESLFFFLYRRFIRLFPSILLCSVLTYFVVELLDPEKEFFKFHSLTPLNFLPSLTFTPPTVWNALLSRTDIFFVNRCHWSLWVEVSFYIVAGTLFFFNKKTFFSNWIKLVIVIVALDRFVNARVIYEDFAFIRYIFYIVSKLIIFFKPQFIIYFTLGIFYYALYSKISISSIQLLVIISLFVVQFALLDNLVHKFFFVVMNSMFITMLYKPFYLKILKLKFITQIGVSSYILYLIHENIGVIAIDKLSLYYSASPLIIKYLPVVVALSFIIFSKLVYQFYEKPVHEFLKKLPRKGYISTINGSK